MEKMSAPKLEVIHFNTEDLIVTSTSATSSIHSIFSTDHTYYTEKSNLINAGYESLGNYEYFHFTPLYDAEIPEFSNPTGDKHLGNVSPSYYYTWYDGSWHTDNLLKEHYIPSN